MGLKQLLSRIDVRPRLQSGLGRRANRVGPALADGWEVGLGLGTGAGWTPLSYGEYYARSAPVYSAIKLRQDAVAGVPLRVCGPEGRPVEPGHPARRLLDRPNPFWTRGDLWRATETYLGLWGSAYWGLERNDRGQPFEMWPLRPDRVRVVPDPDQYIKGFVYVGRGRELVPYAPDDVVWLRYFNPLDEYAGLSPVAPLRLSIDMGLDALQASRNSLTNDSTPGIILESSDTPTDDEVREFYERWEARFKGPERVRRPVLLSGGMKASGLGFSPRDMEYVSALRWSGGGRVAGLRRAQADARRYGEDNLLELPHCPEGLLGGHDSPAGWPSTGRLWSGCCGPTSRTRQDFWSSPISAASRR